MSSKACCYRKTAGAARRWETGILSSEESRFRQVVITDTEMRTAAQKFESSISRKAVSGWTE